MCEVLGLIPSPTKQNFVYGNYNLDVCGYSKEGSEVIDLSATKHFSLYHRIPNLPLLAFSFTKDIVPLKSVLKTFI